MAAIMEPASNSFQTVPYWPIASEISTCTTRSSMVGATSSGQKKEFHWLMNIYRPAATSTGLDMGKIMLTRTRSQVAPSTRAASMSSCGISAKN